MTKVQRSRRFKLRILLTRISCVLCLVVVVFCFNLFVEVAKRPTFQAVSYSNDVLLKSIEFKLDESKTIFTISITLIGVLAALVIGKKDEIVITLKHRLELQMLLCAGILILTSMIFHYLFSSAVVYWCTDMASRWDATDHPIPYLFDPKLNTLFVTQYYCLIAGLICALFTLASAHFLQE